MIEFRTEPASYRHWDLSIDGRVATLAMAVDEGGGLRDGYELKLNSYDLIIDVNLKSYACCNVAFKHLFKQYLKMLNPKGIIITGKKGMKWSRIVKPVLSFSFKNFFYQRLKEFDGPKSNFLSKNELLSLNTRNVYKLSNLKKLILIKKK